MPPPAALSAAAAAVVRFPIRCVDTAEDAAGPADAAERGWYRSAQECARHLAGLTGAATAPARAFGGDWPFVGGDEWLLAPALPLVLSGETGDGADAVYSRRGGNVYREAAGLEELLLTTSGSREPPGRPFDLLWFGEGERHVVRDGVLEVEDLFARVEVPAERELLERLLVRGRRVDEKILEGLKLEPPRAPATITINRAAVLHPDGAWRDPNRFLEARADIEWTKGRAQKIEVRTVAGTKAVFTCEIRDDEWRVVLENGEYPVTEFSMRRQKESLSLTATLDPSVDPLAPGMRGRLAFDLRSDLVELG